METIKLDQDVLKLIKEIKSICFKFEDQKYQVLEIHNSKANFYNFRQNDYPNSTYRYKFKNLSEVASSLGGNLYDESILSMDFRNLHPNLSDPRDPSLTKTQIEEIKQTSEEIYLSGTDPTVR